MSRPLDLEAKNLRELQEERSNLRSLQDHPGYKWLLELSESQINARRSRIFGPLGDFLEVLTQEYAKGEIAGITTFRELVPATIELIDSLIRDKTEENDDELVHSKTNGNDD